MSPTRKSKDAERERESLRKAREAAGDQPQPLLGVMREPFDEEAKKEWRTIREQTHMGHTSQAIRERQSAIMKKRHALRRSGELDPNTHDDDADIGEPPPDFDGEENDIPASKHPWRQYKGEEGAP